ncbi:hypothetical protein [Paenibacillus protaetiae]|uniref:Uncharacterized protein n=1 Tax=Paenibacillus protaetiae TaxID=2509456 RepID=A0A4P6EZ40_9BACL|nr:hypothetical protein [Paenibacillus protaetiae]QAY67543.1 hypothetical protein ET464_15275 [Paenibacillus protaetiae]
MDIGIVAVEDDLLQRLPNNLHCRLIPYEGTLIMSSFMVKDDLFIQQGRFKALPISNPPFNSNITIGGIYRKDTKQKIIETFINTIVI